MDSTELQPVVTKEVRSSKEHKGRSEFLACNRSHAHESFTFLLICQFMLWSGYYHEHFVSGRGDLCCEIQRHKVKGTRVRKPAALEMQPNFYVTLPDDQGSALRKSTGSSHAMLSFGTTNQVPSSCLLDSHQLTNAQAAAASSGHSLIALSKAASPEAFAKMLQSAAYMDLSAFQQHAQQQQQQAQQEQQHQQIHESMAKRLSLLFDPSGPSMDGSGEMPGPEPILLRQVQQQPYSDDLDRSFDALLSVLSRMDPTNAI